MRGNHAGKRAGGAPGQPVRRTGRHGAALPFLMFLMSELLLHRSTSLIRNTPLLGSYGRIVPVVLGGGAVSYARDERGPAGTPKRPPWCRTYTPHPALSTLNPTPSTLHPQPCTLNPQPCTLNPQQGHPTQPHLWQTACPPPPSRNNCMCLTSVGGRGSHLLALSLALRDGGTPNKPPWSAPPLYSLLGPVDPSFRALSGRLQCTV